MTPRFYLTLLTILGAEVSVLICYLMIRTSDYIIPVQQLMFVVAASAITWGATYLVENRND